MKNRTLALFIFIDAMGWEVLQRYPFFIQKLAPERSRLRTVFGYSSACDPSIISGLLPSEHLQWSSFFYAPQDCPYRWIRHLRFLPSPIMNYHKVRHRLSQVIKKIHGFTGYFQIYNVPFAHLPYFDYAEKKRIFAPKGLRKGESIFDLMQHNQYPYYVDDSGDSDTYKFHKLNRALSENRPPFVYILLGKLDQVMHAQGPQGVGVSPLMEWYEEQIQHVYDQAKTLYSDVHLYVFSDHGMHQIEGTHDLQSEIQQLGLSYGKDYVAMYDSTMARFWFLNTQARQVITEKLAHLSFGRIIPDEELKQLGTYFPDHMYGELIFLLHAPYIIAPSYMNRKYLPGMHGFHPDDKDSYASICSNQALPDDLKNIEHIFSIMLKETGLTSNTNTHSSRL